MFKWLSRAHNTRDWVGAAGNRSVSDDGDYVAAVNDALKSYAAFSAFKRDPRYRKILEHTDRELGQKYLTVILRDSPSFAERFDDFRQNDLVGGATAYEYAVGTVSPSTLRYAKVASDLRKLFGDSGFSRVAEIGVGYGGQLLIADKVFAIGTYDLFDLPPVLSLTSRYLESHILNCAYRPITLNQHAGDVDYDLAISNYAFSELPRNLQVKYIEKILSRSRRGYMIMNSGKSTSAFTGSKLSLQELRSLLPGLEVLDEEPLSHRENYVIVWGAGTERKAIATSPT